MEHRDATSSQVGSSFAQDIPETLFQLRGGDLPVQGVGLVTNQHRLQVADVRVVVTEDPFGSEDGNFHGRRRVTACILLVRDEPDVVSTTFDG